MKRLKVTLAGLDSGCVWVAHCDCLSGCTIELRTDTALKTLMLIVYLCQTLMLLDLRDCCGTAEAVDLREFLIELNGYLIFSGHPVLLKFVHSRLSVWIKTVIS